MKTLKLNIEKNKDISNDEESCKLNNNEFQNISRDTSFLTEQLYKNKKNAKKNIFKKFLNLPFICLFFILNIIFTIIIVIIFIISYFKNKPNFNIYTIDWENFKLNNREYEIYNFTNGLEVMLIHDKEFDMDGGAIVINKGILDNPYEEGIAKFAVYLLNYSFSSNSLILNNYFGNYDFDIDKHYINFRFDILNYGFKKYLGIFGSILNHDNISKLFDEYFDKIKMDFDYRLNGESNIDYLEEHLLQYLVYGFKNEKNEEILPEGNRDIIDKYNVSQLKYKIVDYIDKLIDPKNIKIVLFSKYKFLISSKYMINSFKYLINKNSNNNEAKNEYLNNKNENNIIDDLEFKKSQIIYIREKTYDTNYIKIIYYINKINNENYNELFYKEDYFNYIVDILSETKEGSLYALLNKYPNYNIKSITSEFYIIFKTKIKFYIFIELNSLHNINDIIFITYKYMHKIINEGIGKHTQFDRYIELRNLFNQTTKTYEKTYDTMELAKQNGIHLFDFFRKRPKYYFYVYWCPWDETLTDNENKKIIENEAFNYYSQLKPENSVIVLALRDNEINKTTCNDNSPFSFICSYFQKTKISISKYYNIAYINMTFNSSDFENLLEVNNTSNITYVPNNYISIHKDIPNLDSISNSNYIKKDDLTTFYFTQNLSILTPEVFISLNLLHPYLRPLFNDKNKNDCYYFQIFEIFSAIRRKINEVLADAIRANNQIEFGYNENYLYINILCFEDKAEKILTEIKNIIFDTDWNQNDFIFNNEMYKFETYDYFLNFQYDIDKDVGKYYFYKRVKNGLYNKYDFNLRQFESIYANCFKNYIKNNTFNLTKFVVNGSMYGYFNDTMPDKIFKIFKRENIDEEKIIMKKLLIEVNNTINIDDFSHWNNEILQLYKFDYIEINSTNYKLEANTNISYLSILYNDSIISSNFMKASILDIMFNNILDNFKVSNIELFTYRDVYFQIIYYNYNNNSIEGLFKELLEEAKNIYNQSVDNIGDKFYYLQKNLGLILFKSQSSLKQKAIEDLNYKIYKYSELTLEQIIKSNNERYNFETIINFVNNINFDRKYDIKVIEKEN